MSTLYQLNGRLALTNAALAQQQHALAVNLYQNAVPGQPGRQIVLQGGDHGGDQLRGGLIGAQDGDVILPCHDHAFIAGLQMAGIDQCRRPIGKQPVKGDHPLLRGKPRQIGVLHHADNLHPGRLKMLKEARKLERRPVDILYRDLDLLKIRRAVQHFQLKFLGQMGQRDGKQ